jgi:hypothetical protein
MSVGAFSPTNCQKLIVINDDLVAVNKRSVAVNSYFAYSYR